LLAIALPLPVRSPEVRLAWSLFRREARGSGHVIAITDDALSDDTLVHALMHLHNYGCSTNTNMRSNNQQTHDKNTSEEKQNEQRSARF